MRNKLVSIIPTKKQTTELNPPSVFSSLINFIFKNKESLFVPGSNHCMFGEKKGFMGTSVYKDRRFPINGQLFAIGDIHGCFDKIKPLINTINPSRKDILVFLGDYIDRGPKSKEVLDFLDDLQAKTSCVFLGGNHEYMYLHQDSYWLTNGGYDTLLSYKCPINFKNILINSIRQELNIPAESLEKLLKIMSMHHLASDSETLIESDYQFNLLLKIIKSCRDQYSPLLADYIIDAPRETPLLTHGNFFMNLRDSAITQGRWKMHYHLSHAGFDPLDQTNINKLIGMTNDRHYMLKSGYVNPLLKYILGHTPVVTENLDLFDYTLSASEHEDFTPFVTKGYVNIDTASYFSKQSSNNKPANGRITAMELPTETFIFSP